MRHIKKLRDILLPILILSSFLICQGCTDTSSRDGTDWEGTEYALVKIKFDYHRAKYIVQVRTDTEITHPSLARTGLGEPKGTYSFYAEKLDVQLRTDGKEYTTIKAGPTAKALSDVYSYMTIMAPSEEDVFKWKHWISKQNEQFKPNKILPN